MATVTGLTAARMLQIEAASVVDGDIVGDNLILKKHDNTTIDAGNVRGPVGPQGPPGVQPPTGGLMPWAGSVSTPPAGWLVCDGSAISRTTYSALFAILGTAYGIGDGSTTFNLPNLEGRVIVGVDDSDTDFNARGKIGGAKTHTLATAEMPAHTHNLPAHTHTVSGTNNFLRWTGTGGSLASPGAGSALNGEALTVSGGGGGATTSAGSGTAFNIQQPFMAMGYIIKT